MVHLQETKLVRATKPIRARIFSLGKSERSCEKLDKTGPAKRE